MDFDGGVKNNAKGDRAAILEPRRGARKEKITFPRVEDVDVVRSHWRH